MTEAEIRASERARWAAYFEQVVALLHLPTVPNFDGDDRPTTLRTLAGVIDALRADEGPAHD